MQFEDEGVYPCYWSLLHGWNISFCPSFKILIRALKRTCVFGERHDLLKIRFLIKEGFLTLTSRTEMERCDVEDLPNAPSFRQNLYCLSRARLAAPENIGFGQQAQEIESYVR